MARVDESDFDQPARPVMVYPDPWDEHIFGRLGDPSWAEFPDWLKGQHAPELPIRIRVDKTSHRIRYENEDETSLDLIIEPKASGP